MKKIAALLLAGLMSCAAVSCAEDVELEEDDDIEIEEDDDKSSKYDDLVVHATLPDDIFTIATNAPVAESKDDLTQIWENLMMYMDTNGTDASLDTMYPKSFADSVRKCGIVEFMLEEESHVEIDTDDFSIQSTYSMSGYELERTSQVYNSLYQFVKIMDQYNLNFDDDEETLDEKIEEKMDDPDAVMEEVEKWMTIYDQARQGQVDAEVPNDLGITKGIYITLAKEGDDTTWDFPMYYTESDGWKVDFFLCP